MHPLLLIQTLKRQFADYVLSKYPWSEASKDYKDLEKVCLTPGEIFQDPVIQFDRPRMKLHINSVQEISFFCDETQKMLLHPQKEWKELRPGREPFGHQYKAWERIANHQPTVISTGTGSGKSEAFIIPLLDLVLRAKKQESSSAKRCVRAIVIYPMNALVEDQHIRFCRFAAQMKLKVGVYTGSFNEVRTVDAQMKQRTREWMTKIFGNPDLGLEKLKQVTEIVDPKDSDTTPDVLLTNYSMLEYMLLRSKDHSILQGAKIEVIALDEAHLYSGTLGLEVAALLARLRVHTDTSRFVPVATSATLMRGERRHDQLAGFFSGIFGCAFPKDDEQWLIQDTYEAEVWPEPELWREVSFPEADIDEMLSLAEFDTAAALQKLCKTLEEHPLPLAKMAQQLPTLLLSRNWKERKTFRDVVTWTDAVRRYGNLYLSSVGSDMFELDHADFLKREKELSFLLSAVSLPHVEGRFPYLGLRVHLFAKSEPSLFRRVEMVNGRPTAAGILAESEIAPPDNDSLALPIAICRNCDHEGWVVVVSDQSRGSFTLDPLTRAPADDETVWVLYPYGSLTNDDLTRGWLLQTIDISLDGEGRLEARQLEDGGKKKTNPLMKTHSALDEGRFLFHRVSRVAKEGGNAKEMRSQERQDHTHCPNCLKTHPVEQMVRRRGSPSSDLGVHTRNLLGGIEEQKERSLLIFCDNRQNTSFLAGFLSDRHKRFRLRRAITRTLQVACEANQRIPFVDQSANSSPMAIQVIEEIKRYLGDKSSAGKVRLSTFRKSLMAELFSFQQKSFQHDYDESTRDFLSSIHPVELVSEEDEETKDWEIELSSHNSRVALRLLSEGILRELSLGSHREGALPSLGICCLWHSSLDHPELPFPNLARILFWECLKTLAWSDKPLSLRSPDYTYETIRIDDLIEKIRKNTTSLGRAVRGSQPDLVVAWGLVDSGGTSKEASVDDIRKHVLHLLNVYQSLGLFTIKTKETRGPVDRFALSAPGLFAVGDTVQFVGNLRKQRITVPAHINLSGLATGIKKNELWERAPQRELAHAWRKLYCEAGGEDDNFVRAHEHNAMLKAKIASKVIDAFSNRTLNTLVATPTLEMGIDLPDLPVVIHSSVPPDPSNYAQRSGRAGRDTRRALIFAQCGRGSHDTGYYGEPAAMVAGVIAPPGIPRENTYLLARHVRALVIELMAAQGLDTATWRHLAKRQEFIEFIRKDYDPEFAKRNATSDEDFDWKRVFTQLEPTARHKVEELKAVFKEGLWDGFQMIRSAADLGEEIMRALADFPRDFADAIEQYHGRIRGKVERLKKVTGHTPEARREIDRLIASLRPMLDEKSRASNDYAPISFLGALGFLPNFDFPAESVRFSGLGRNFNGDSKRPDTLVSFQRGMSSSLSEFAPEQKVYANGYIFEVDRYTAKAPSAGQNDLAGFGVCSAGCTEVTPIKQGKDVCNVCGSPLVGKNTGPALPPIVELVSVEGWERDLIGDSKANRETHQFSRRALTVKHDRESPRTFQHQSLGATRIEEFRRSGINSHLIEMLAVLGLRDKKTSPRALAPLYRDKDDPEGFRVLLHPDENRECTKPFLIGYRFEAEALRICVDFDNLPLVQQRGTEESFYITLKAVILKAAKRELFLNPRSSHLEAFLEETCQRSDSGETRVTVNGMYLYDSIKGGSGVIPLLVHYWNAIMARASDIIRSDEAPHNCCKTSCSRCLRAYDNQWEHEKLDKAALMIQHSNEVIPVTDLLTGIRSDGADGKNWSAVLNVTNAIEESDPDFPLSEAERALRRFFEEKLPGVQYVEQSELFESHSDRLVTRPDLSFESGGNRFAIFVDGAKYHANPATFCSDLHKRNFCTLVAKWTPISIPAKRVLYCSEWDSLAEDLGEVLRGRRAGSSPMAPAWVKRISVRIDPEEYELPERNVESEIILDAPWREPTEAFVASLGKLGNLRIIGLDIAASLLLIEPDLQEIFGNSMADSESSRKWTNFWDTHMEVSGAGWGLISLIKSM